VWQTNTANTPVALGHFATNTGKITYVSNGVTYFAGLTQIKDPALAGVSSANSLNSSFNLLAIADANGNPILVHPAPGQSGTLGRNTIEGPKVVALDMNLIKRVQITETKQFEFRLDVTNVLNHPNFGSPVTSIDSTSFGRITTASSARRFTMNARVNF
jgi:hypothetical protein